MMDVNTPSLKAHHQADFIMKDVHSIGDEHHQNVVSYHNKEVYELQVDMKDDNVYANGGGIDLVISHDYFQDYRDCEVDTHNY